MEIVRRIVNEAESADPWCLRWYAWWWLDHGGLVRSLRVDKRTREDCDGTAGLLWLADRERWPRPVRSYWTFWAPHGMDNSPQKLPFSVVNEFRRLIDRDPSFEWFAPSPAQALETMAFVVVRDPEIVLGDDDGRGGSPDRLLRAT